MGLEPTTFSMAGEEDHQAGEAAKNTKGGRKGKVVQQVQIDDEATDGNETEFNEAEEGSDSNDDNEWYDYDTLAKIMEVVPKLTSQNYYSWSTLIKATLRVVPHAIQHLEGTYDSNHPKWNRTFDDALAGVLRSTFDTEGEHNILYLLLEISKAFSGSRRVTGSYERSTGVGDLVDTSDEHGRSAVSMETMDSYGLTCKGGPSSRSMQTATTQGLER
ncbi:hypothetical protein NDA18_002930 [Ustilago nuda]|nr:hypothetical protein NDA18_002930 [Ustilago nuda]